MIEVKELTTIEELRQVQQLEEKIWNKAPLPLHQTITAIKHGGIIVGAYDGEQLIGFSYGFAAFKDKKGYLCSHILGVELDYRSQKIGGRLKQTQREIAIQKGYDKMVWTFDPLESRNGYVNLTKLNGICDTYIENCYGEIQSGLNQGLPTDRFEVHWYLTSDYVSKELEPNIEGAVPLATIYFDAEGLPLLENFNVTQLVEPVYKLPVPNNFEYVKTKSHKHAMHWRLQTRAACTALFAAGYAAVRVYRQQHYNEYIFVKKQTLALG